MKSRGRYVTILMIAAALLICGVLANYARAGFRWAPYQEYRWRCAGSSGCTTGSSGDDINGEVGYPMELFGPTAVCNDYKDPWTASHRIVSGAFPPGIDWGKNCVDAHCIGGIPTERGHWIVRLELYDVQCGGQFYKGFEQELRFHISGSGKVNQ
jgi:hypothetical protein